MAYPIIEQLAQAVVTAIATVTIENGYANDLTVIRESRAGANPQHLLAIVMQDYDGETVVIPSNPPILEIPVVFTVAVIVTPDDDDDTAVDQLLNQAWADVTKAMTAGWDTDTAGTIGGLAREWTVLTPERFGPDQGAFDGILCPYRAIVRVSENDPYTQR